jgi:hypothetical protein
MWAAVGGDRHRNPRIAVLRKRKFDTFAKFCIRLRTVDLLRHMVDLYHEFRI